MSIILKVIRAFGGHEGMANAVAFSPDGTLLATGSRDKRVNLWHVETGDLVRTIDGHHYSVNSVAFSPTGKMLVVGAGEWPNKGEAKIWDVSSGELCHTLASECDAVDVVSFSPSGEEVAVITGFGCGPRDPVEPNARIYDVRTSEVRLELHRQNCIAFSPDGETLAAGGPDCKIQLHHNRSGEMSPTSFDQQGNVLSLAFSPDGSRLVSGGFAIGGSGAVKVWDVAAGRIEHSLLSDERSIHFLWILNGGGVIATDSEHGVCRLWDVTTGQMLAHTDEPKTAQPRPRRFAISPDEALLAAGSDEADGAAKLWSLPNFR